MTATPARSYTVWFTQRVGSSVLCRGLADLGHAGRPDELLNVEAGRDLPAVLGVADHDQARDLLWQRGMTPNGVFGLKHGLHEPRFSWIIAQFRQMSGVAPDAPRIAVWEHVFPNHRHIFMTRRNKVRLAVSWWKAVCTQEWHREAGGERPRADLEDRYLFPAIDHLVAECALREAAIQEFFAEGDVRPLTLTYEDLLLDFPSQIRAVLDYLDLPCPDALPEPAYQRMADEVSESWVQRYRQDKQRTWDKKVW